MERSDDGDMKTTVVVVSGKKEVRFVRPELCTSLGFDSVM